VTRMLTRKRGREAVEVRPVSAPRWLEQSLLTGGAVSARAGLAVCDVQSEGVGIC
jgi:hypothetical protein